MGTLASFIVSFIASLAVVVLIYWGLQRLSSSWLLKRAIGEAECWYLPCWNCFRLVVRNIPGRHTLHFMKWRVWLRRILPAQADCSVDTFLDTDIGSGERIYLPTGQDLPIICFRFDDNTGNTKLLVTDKIGNVQNSYDLDGVDSVMAEYHVAVRHWFVFKHDINRIVLMPLSKEEVRGQLVDFLRDYYFAQQKRSSRAGLECRVKVYKLEEEITVQL